MTIGERGGPGFTWMSRVELTLLYVRVQQSDRYPFVDIHIITMAATSSKKSKTSRVSHQPT